MKIIKYHSLLLALIIILLGVFLGLILGWFYSGWVVEGIAEEIRRTNPNDSLDGLFFVQIGILVKSFVAGTLLGIVSGTISYFFVGGNKRLD